ncbi:MAG: DUF5666 domain-containing protein [Burkholderiaceae bacterium]
MKSMQIFAIVSRRVACLLLVALVGCGGSGVGSGGSGVPAGVQTGTVNGFGSVIVDSTVYEDENASVSVDLDGESAPALTPDDVRLGMQIRLTFEQEAVAQSVEINPQLIGPVDSVTATEIVVAGQTVSIVASGARPTLFAGFDTLSELNQGDRVAVFGLFGEAGRLFATRIQSGAPGPATLIKVTGTINFIGLLRQGIRIGDQVFELDNGTRSDVAPRELRVGDLVSVWADTTGSRSLRARRLELEEPRPTIGSVRRTIGFVRQAPVNGVAVIGRNRIDVSNASFPIGSISDLTPGRLVLVSGQVEDRTLSASLVTFLDLNREGDVSVAGTVSALMAGTSLQVRNTRVDLRLPDLRFTNGVPADLIDGARVQVRGSIVNGRFVAREIEFAR